MTTRSQKRCPTHPGALLREIVIPAIRLPKVAIAKALGVSRQTLHDLVTENQAMTASMAVRVAAVFGGSPESYLTMQANYDMWHAKRTTDVSGLRRIRAC